MAASQTGYTLTKISSLSDISIGGSLRQMGFDVAPTASTYFTTGYLITPANVGLKVIYFAHIGSQNPPSGTPITTLALPFWDVANTALQFFESTTGAPSLLAEVASGADVSAFVVRILFIGN